MSKQRANAQLITKDYLCTGALGTKDVNNFQLPTDRGDAIGFEIVVPSETIADTGVSLITVAVNGFNVIEEAVAILFSTKFAGTKHFIPQHIPDSAEIQVTVDALLSAGNVPCFFKLIYAECGYEENRCR